eukprot:PLAT4780.1.p1 GENE.PLAT4780.1~~PLAT4780.1.p1  ORF type:complete len:568 (+),score=65.02 PLAT4780.1:3-1706(+)
MLLLFFTSLLLTTAVSAQTAVNLTAADSATFTSAYGDVITVEVGVGFAAELTFDPPVSSCNLYGGFPDLGSDSVSGPFWAMGSSTSLQCLQSGNSATFTATLRVLRRASYHSVADDVASGQNISVSLPTQGGLSLLSAESRLDSVEIEASCSGSASLQLLVGSSAYSVACGSVSPLQVELAYYAGTFMTLVNGTGGVNVSVQLVAGEPLSIPPLQLPSQHTVTVSQGSPAFFYMPAGKWAAVEYSLSRDEVLADVRYSSTPPFTRPYTWADWPATEGAGTALANRSTLAGELYVGLFVSNQSYTASIQFGAANDVALLQNSPFVFGKKSSVTVQCDNAGIFVVLSEYLLLQSPNATYTVEVDGTPYEGPNRGSYGFDDGVLVPYFAMGNGSVTVTGEDASLFVVPQYRRTIPGYHGVRGVLQSTQMALYQMETTPQQHAVYLESERKDLIAACSPEPPSPMTAWSDYSLFLSYHSPMLAPQYRALMYCIVKCGVDPTAKQCSFHLYVDSLPEPPEDAPFNYWNVIVPVAAVVLVVVIVRKLRRDRQQQSKQQLLLQNDQLATPSSTA